MEHWNIESVGNRSASPTANISINMLLLFKKKKIKTLGRCPRFQNCLNDTKS